MVGEGWDSPRGKGVQHVESMKRERNIMRYLSETGPVTSSDCFNLNSLRAACCEVTDFHVHADYDLGITPGLLFGHFAIVASSIFRCWATNAGGVCVSQLDREISSYREALNTPINCMSVSPTFST